ncbi:hypothetical protein GCM10011612_02890 [Actinomyces gaoshouyii]|uniref:Uncharacterized protein n=1 Tax=Actinomyces gaoshouyii TaxID=1960083 RepID=A0A8H9HCC9_9ACTO|nr:hypothetical protein GCM10011612_02890 [Actinomyces gaoshouyii]
MGPVSFERRVRDDPGNYRDIRIAVKYADPGITSPTGPLKGLDPTARIPEKFDVSWINSKGFPDRSIFPNEAISEGGVR